jgi:hypothetical protein
MEAVGAGVPNAKAKDGWPVLVATRKVGWSEQFGEQGQKKKEKKNLPRSPNTERKE